MASDPDLKRKVRSDYINRRMTIATISQVRGVSQATISRWKKSAKTDGDNWDMLRSASIIAGEGIETVVSTVVEDFMIMAEAVLDEIKHGELTVADKVKHLVALADAMTKMTSSAGKLAPTISEMGVAQDVMRHLLEFVREEFPHHAGVILEIIEPFGERLAGLYHS
ncbi:DUF1804 family protein [Martelella mediterranea]|uniref:Uncharacterized protein DUF1804 n=1 Tax=Martelella mediterranea TaxID=293089 RepID=A0A4R3NR55_9HYPH|nr:DUF1804 family protein [Martelella mediterranea]TCT37440.1 uncharacterized protein DUF1804 [Martelella mediterranea]